jgi:dipeptidyl aminopeptidase/acylaminoacyl peptidase
MELSHMRCINKNIVFSVWYIKNHFKRKNPFVGIMCHGLPSHPYQHNPAKIEKLILEGWILIYPNYKGTWASKGDMSWEGCVETIIDMVNYISKGNIKSVNNQNLFFENPRIVLIGGSFGGSVALVAGAKSPLVKDIVCVAGVTNWRNHQQIPGEDGEPMDKLYKSVLKGYGPLWRITSKKEWLKLEQGSVDLNPIDYHKKLSEQNVFLVYGKKDNIVSSKRGIELYKELKKGSGKHELILLDKGHCDYNVFSNENLYNKLSIWLKRN